MRTFPYIMAPLLALAGCEPGLSPRDTEQKALTGGTFTMGSTAVCSDARGGACGGDRAPHPVQVSPFLLDATEVTHLQYAACVQAGGCPFQGAFEATRKDEPALVDDPAAARRYCEWKKARLPTEAEFEYAARVGRDGMPHKYPWGDEEPTCARVAFAGCGATRPPPVGTYDDVNGAGVRDLAGSVPEWVEDTYVPGLGCAARLGYTELCWGRSGDCVEQRCKDDGMACLKGCLPPAEDVASAAMGGTTAAPVCPRVGGMAAALVDPVVRSGSGLGVVRGGSFADSVCALAGYSRRHATPGRFAAGFRCARSMDMGKAPTPPTAYRLALGNCALGSEVKVTVQTGDGKPAAYDLDVFAPGKAMATSTAAAGVVAAVPCDAVLVVRPGKPAALQVDVRSTDPMDCRAASRLVDLAAGGDVPAVGTDRLSLAPGGDCG